MICFNPPIYSHAFSHFLNGQLTVIMDYFSKMGAWEVRSIYLLVPQPGQPYSAPLMLHPANGTPELTTWVVVEAELDAMAVHHACGGRVGAVSVLTAKGKPDSAAHALLSRCARILVALDADEDKPDGANPGAEAWAWWKRTYPQARLWPVPEGKDPGEAFALGVDLAEWIYAGCPIMRPANVSGLNENQNSSPDCGGMGKSRKEAVAEVREPSFQCLPIPDGLESFEALRLPEKITHLDLLRSMSKHDLDDPECLLPCPKTSPAFWWKYYRDCLKKRCDGHPQCVLGVLRSPLFMEALKIFESGKNV